MSKVQTCSQHTYLCAYTGFAFLVLLVTGSLVQFAPQRFGLPAGQSALQVAVEGLMLQRIQLQVCAHDVKGLQGGLTGGRLDEGLKHPPCPALLIVHLSHPSLCASEDTGSLISLALSFCLSGAALLLLSWGRAWAKPWIRSPGLSEESRNHD